MSYDVLQANGRDKDGGQMIKLLENRTCSSGIEEGVLAIVMTRADSSLPRENPGCISLTIQMEATAKDLCHIPTGSHSQLPNKYLDSTTSQCQTSHSPLM